MAYKDDSSLDASAVSVAALSVIIGVFGAWLAIKSPHFYDRADLREAHAAGAAGEVIPARIRDPGIRILGVVFCAVSLVGVWVASNLATTDPRKMVPPSVDVDGDGRELAPATEEETQDLVGECQELLEVFIADNIPVKAAMSARCLAILGDMGAGKTLYADQLVTWRQVRRNDFVVVANPHYHMDTEKMLYSTADLVLPTPQAIREQLPEILRKALQTPLKKNDKDQQRLTIVLDEFSKWHKNSYGLGDIAEEVLDIGSQDIRKANLELVVTIHGKRKGMIGGEKTETGRAESFLKQSVVVTLEIEEELDSEDADPEWTGRGDVSARGSEFEGGKRTKFQLPKLLGPKKYPDEIAPYFRAAVSALRPKEEDKPTAEQLLEEAVKRFDNRKDEKTHPVFGMPRMSMVTPSAYLNGNKSNWDALFEIAHADDFCTWLIKKEHQKDETLDIEKIRGSWGKHYVGNKAQVIEFLAAMNAYGLGEFDKIRRPKKWVLKVAPEDILLPDSAEA